MKLFGNKRAYFSSLSATVFALIWTCVFYAVFRILFVEWLLPAFTDFFPSSHVYLKNTLGADYRYVLRTYFVYINSIASLMLGMKFGFKGAKKRKIYFCEFTNGVVKTRDAFAHHYKSYGILDLIISFVLTLFLFLVKSVVDLTSFFPHIFFFDMLLPPSPTKTVLCFILSSLLLFLCSVYGVYSSQKIWCADILYDWE